MRRRRFLRTGLLGGIAAAWSARASGREPGAAPPRAPGEIRVLSTHPAGMAANLRAVQVLEEGGSALDAVEAGVMVAEANPEDTSVGYGGYPNADGVVQLDAAVMDGTTLGAGSVAALEEILHPVSVARLVLERTPHVLLVGKGAQRFALSQGFRKQNLLTDRARRAWKDWKRSRNRPESHDTIGMIAMTAAGTMAASCTTSGLAWKLPGRVGDSPLIGHGLYCDGKAGGAAGTGIGEEVIKVCGSYQIVEFLRQGIEPEEAVRRVLDRILARNPAMQEQFIGFVALRADGEAGFASTTSGFQAALYAGGRHRLLDAPRHKAS